MHSIFNTASFQRQEMSDGSVCQIKGQPMSSRNQQAKLYTWVDQIQCCSLKTDG